MIDKKKNNFVCTPQSFGKLTKDPLCAMLLGQLYFWALTEDEWFDRTQAKIFEITSISQQNTARSKLEEMGFIKVERRGIPARLFYKINFDSIELAHEQIGFKLPEYKISKNAQHSKTTTYNDEKNLPSEPNNKLWGNRELNEQSKKLTYSLANAQKINPETLVVAKQVCVKLEEMGIDRVPSADDPTLLFVIECGGTVERFESAAKKAVQRGKTRANFEYVATTVRNRMEDAARLAANPVVHGKAKAVYQASSPTPSHASHVEVKPEPPKNPTERLKPERLDSVIAMFARPRGN